MAEQSREEYKLSSGAAGSQHLSAQHRSDRSLIFIPKHLQRASVAIIPETLLLAFVIIKGSRICLQATRSQEPIFISVRDSSALVSRGTEAFVPRDIFRQAVSLGHALAGPLRSTVACIKSAYAYRTCTVPYLVSLSSSKIIVSRAEASVHPALLLLLRALLDKES